MLQNYNLSIICLKYILALNMVFVTGEGLFPAVRFSVLALTVLNRNKSYGVCCDGQIGCDASLLEAGTALADRLAAWP